MSQVLTLELSDEVYAALQQQAKIEQIMKALMLILRENTLVTMRKIDASRYIWFAMLAV